MHWWSEELDQLKQECIEATNLWHHFGHPRSGDINAYHTRIKLRYKNAVKIAAQNAETELNSSLAEYMCSKYSNSFWKAWRKRFCLNKLKPAQTINGKVGDKILWMNSPPFIKISVYQIHAA